MAFKFPAKKDDVEKIRIMLTRYRTAQKAELSRWQRRRAQLPESEVINEFELLGVDISSVTGRVLDVGGAYGRYASVFSNASERVVVDPLYDEFGIALEGVMGITAPAEELPFEPGSVDFIILRNVIDHMLDPTRLLKESRRVLASDGAVYFMVNTFISATRPFFPIMNRCDRPHPLHFTIDGVRKLIAGSGFRIKRERVSPSGAFEWRIKRLAGKLIKREYYALLTPA